MIIYGDMITTVTGDGVKQERLLRFRSDGNIICGSRFREMPDTIEVDAKKFLDVFKEAVLASFNGNTKEMEKAAVEQEKEKQEKAEKFVEQEKNSAKADDLKNQLKELLPKVPKESQKAVKDKLKELIGTTSYTTCDDAEILGQCVEFVQGLIG